MFFFSLILNCSWKYLSILLKGTKYESETGKKIKETLKAQETRRYISVGSGNTKEDVQRKLKQVTTIQLN